VRRIDASASKVPSGERSSRGRSVIIKKIKVLRIVADVVRDGLSHDQTSVSL